MICLSECLRRHSLLFGHLTQYLLAFITHQRKYRECSCLLYFQFYVNAMYMETIVVECPARLSGPGPLRPGVCSPETKVGSPPPLHYFRYTYGSISAHVFVNDIQSIPHS